MCNKRTTRVPNFLFDIFLPNLTESELKVILIVIRQTVGWLDQRTGERKTRDRISISQFEEKTGLSKRTINQAIQSLVVKQLLVVTGFKGNPLNQPRERKGKSYLFFSLNQPAYLATPTSAKTASEPAQNCDHNKSKSVNETKGRSGFSGHISNLIPQATTGALICALHDAIVHGSLSFPKLQFRKSTAKTA